MLGAPDFGQYCRSAGYDRLELGALHIIHAATACRWQYPGYDPPAGWECWW